MIRLLFSLYLALFFLGCRADQSPPPPTPDTPNEPATTTTTTTIPDEEETVRTKNQRAVQAAYQANQKTHAGNPDIMVKPGLVADRRAKRIELMAEASGLTPREVVEFFLIHEKSGHDYEALAMTFADPEDVREALLFIGMAPGRGTAPGQGAFWPKGERVFMSFDGVRVERFLIDTRTDKPLPEVGLVFIGSIPVPDPEAPDRVRYAVAIREPRAIASNYNEPEALLDVPRHAPQDSVYKSQAVNPNRLLEGGTLITVTLEPEHKDGALRVKDLTLSIQTRANANAMSTAYGTEAAAQEAISRLAFSVTDNTEKAIHAHAPLNQALQCFVGFVQQKRDPFVSVRFDDNVELGAAREVAKVLNAIDSESGIRVEPPAKGQLFYRAYMPDENNRGRDKRLIQPFELHVDRTDQGIRLTLINIHETWTKEAARPDLTIEEIPIQGPDHLRHTIDSLLRQEFETALGFITDAAKRAPLQKRYDDASLEELWGVPGDILGTDMFVAMPDGVSMNHKILRGRVFLIYAPASATVGEIRPYTEAMVSTHANIHVFVE